MHLLVRARLAADDVELRVVDDGAAFEDRHLREHVDLAALKRQHLWLHVGVEGELRPVEQRLRAPVVVVPHEGGACLGDVFLELERAGADEALLEPAGVVRRQDHQVVVVR